MHVCAWVAVTLGLLLTLIGLHPVQAQSSVTTPLNNATSLPVGSCTPTIPCSNGACCNGNSGFCGFGPEYCTPVASGGNCTSSCDAQAECGPNAPPANITCPLNVCCSQYGFCGTTADFCGTGCQSNCGEPVPPVCGTETDSALTRRIGYYNGAAASRGCMAFPPEQIYTEDLTHVNFAFASISNSFQVVEANPGDSQLWQRTTNLKSQDPTLEIFLSIGGWNFNDPPTSTIFSQLVASTANTDTFIASVLSVMETYAFDGIDIDWEYPGAYDRGGGPADTENYVTFMAAVKAAFRSEGYGLSFTAPSSYWYLQHFDLPGLLKSADWVNVMTYDLHGVWDGTDPYVGYVLDAHTNLTEIDEAFDLYWRVGVNPSQVTMGFAFYGRTFTLASSACWEPGCAWVSGGNPGPCSATSGILMWSEIEPIFNTSGDAQSVIDPDAAVNYMMWDTNQWVSFDNAETFAMKMNYANDHCIGGSMIWSLDQDDSTYTALTGLYGNVTQGIASGVSQSTGCIETDWNVNACPDGYSFVGSDQNLDGESRFICCESGNAPSPESCAWRLFPADSSTCLSVCPPGDILLATSTSFCMSGAMPFCCHTNVTAIENCTVGGCSTTPTCPAGNSSESLFVTTVVNGNPGTTSNDLPCTGGESKPFCCDGSDFPYQNCKWVGTPPLCLDDGCAIGQIAVISDVQGDASQPCSGSGSRTYCCDPIGSAYVPVPFYDIFPSNITEGAETFDVEFDPDVTNSPQVASGSNSTTTDNENTEAFGEVFIDSPNANAVSSMAVVSDWVVTSCDPTSDQAQTVLAYCSKSMDNSGCAHVFIGGAEHTIVQMPSSCGLGPYARVASLTPHVNQSILPETQQAKKPANELVYSLSFDYDFSVIPESNGPIYMRADVTDMPGYWDNVVDSPPERKRWLQEQEMKKPLHRRWWGAFTTWLAKITTVEETASVGRVFSWADTWTIYQDSVACPGSTTMPSFEASLDIKLMGSASTSARFGYYLQATVVPPSVQAAYLYFNADANAYAEFTIDGLALVQYDSSTIQFASFGFPGLYYPGLLTIGPSLVINGYITGQLSVQATLQLSTQIQFPPVNIQLGAVNDSFTGLPSTMTQMPVGMPTTNFGTQVELAGDLSVHLVPAIQIGVSVLNGAVIDAQAYVQSDLYAGISLNSSVSNTQAPQACYNIYYGIDFYGGLTGSLLYWESGTVQWPFYQTEFSASSKCWNPSSGSAKREVSELQHPEPLHQPIIQRAPDERYPAYILEKNGDQERYIYPVKQLLTIDPPAPTKEQLMKRDTSAAIPQVPGMLTCPGPDGINQTSDDVYADLPTNLLDAWEKRRRSIEDIPDEFDHHFDDDWDYDLSHDDFEQLFTRELHLEELSTSTVQIPGCANREFSAYPYTGKYTATNEYWDFQYPGRDLAVSTYTANTAKSPFATSITYAREHIYEIQLISLFIGDLQSQQTVWSLVSPTFCDWVDTILNGPVLNDLLMCLPSNKRSNNPPYMPWLEAWANGAKARAFSGSAISDPNEFKSYGASRMVAVMRGTVGLVSYMNNPRVVQSFVSQSQCMRGVWYNQNSSLGSVYDAWIKAKVTGFNTAMQNGITSMLQGWNNRWGSSVVGIYVSYANDVTMNPTLVTNQVTAQDLQQYLVNYVQANPVAWTSQL
ncbi:glycoside hydrolase family 18 protein [Hydnomerulius pinastri MD-312]|uniref:Unplaced genomic scaffold scaffold_69, whole genome shotgun sequence n=1 Tax=Hydnomerulius pinastri MD-312 TaxID=994086 RepID=A0A0C9VZM0_9AGAM|nr:glycoside hydrolase family 18 protein [Hydnomerulius pinastri MD-312]